MVELILTSAVTRSSPAFHNPGHLRMWYDSPFRNFDAHLFTAIIVMIICAGVGWFVYFQLKNRASEEKLEANTDEKQFHDLVVKQKVIMNKLLELEEMKKTGNLSDADYENKSKAYREHLVKVKVQLQQFMD
ncbi:hypothetical protein BKP45_09140 [Anaerobacillus alkalidiazotrophicus]|uniref:Uncharacterized protein n=1 Tax=Anaerobacillus alkalidiazotrophicus TaxID=472963 RepID=A0A1S2M7E1_9BACI|nr:hypothetical protein [Anaerobacillus alkalidiazotrophicus]OIJ20403.1 hypothetical protein BKP45_09140 [Anaerobacillus alkalidiazotrophicus]